MKLEIHASTVEWILQQMEMLTHKVMVETYVGDSESIIANIGKFNAFKELLDNAGYESYGLKFQIKIPTLEEYGAKQN